MVGAGGSLPWAANLSRADEHQHHFPSANGVVADKLGLGVRPAGAGTSYGVTQASGLLGVALEPLRAIVFQGHSIVDGANAATVTDQGLGYAAYASVDEDGSVLYAFHRSCVGGDRVQHMAATRTRRRRVYAYADYLILDGIVNDVATRTAAQILSDVESVAADAKAAGIAKVGVVLCLPKTSGTFADAAGQTIAAGFEPGGVRDQVNAALWSRAFAGTHAHDFVVNFNGVYAGEGTGTMGALAASAEGVEDPANPGKWRGGMAPDGTHPGDLAHASVLAPRLRAAVKAWCPAV